MSLARSVKERVLLYTETIDVCAKSGDPGCLGTRPQWHPHGGPCDWWPAEFTACVCGAHELHQGELHHEPHCPLHEDASYR